VAGVGVDLRRARRGGRLPRLPDDARRDIGRQSEAAWLGALVISAVLFGFGHYYKGPAGILDSGVAGLILGGAYLLSGRVLWTAILAHGFIDTFGVMALYLGWEG